MTEEKGPFGMNTLPLIHNELLIVVAVVVVLT
jgi:hypothetical protein